MREKRTETERVVRPRRLTSKQAQKYAALRSRIETELPDLIHRHHQREGLRAELQRLLVRLKQARQSRGPNCPEIARGLRAARSTSNAGRHDVKKLLRDSEKAIKQVLDTLEGPAGR